MRKIFLILAALALISIFLAGCKTQDVELEGNDWCLTSYGDADSPTALLADTEVTLFFNSGEGTLNGSAGCNNYFADYEISGSQLTITDIANTEIYCISPEGVMDQEAAFLSLLGDSQSFEVEGEALTVFCSSGQVLFFTTADR